MEVGARGEGRRAKVVKAAPRTPPRDAARGDETRPARREEVGEVRRGDEVRREPRDRRTDPLTRNRVAEAIGGSKGGQSKRRRG